MRFSPACWQRKQPLRRSAKAAAATYLPNMKGSTRKARSPATSTSCGTPNRFGRNLAHWRRCPDRARPVDQPAIRIFPFGTLRHGRPDYATLKKARDCRRIAYPPPDGTLTFDRLSSVFLSNTNREEDQPVHLVLATPPFPLRSICPNMTSRRSVTVRRVFMRSSRDQNSGSTCRTACIAKPRHHIRAEYRLGRARGRRSDPTIRLA